MINVQGRMINTQGRVTNAPVIPREAQRRGISWPCEFALQLHCDQEISPIVKMTIVL